MGTLKERLPAVVWIACLAPFFFLTYNLANDLAARRQDSIPVLMFAWERHIPFLPWTIVPYWSSDLLYGISLLLCRTRQELSLQGRRLLAIQIFSVALFLAFPLRCSWTRPVIEGWAAGWFGALWGFDQPFNQAPSLHVGLALLLWLRFRRHCSAGWQRLLVAGWLVLIALSTLTTWQHHFIDLPAGLWAGLLVAAALPEDRPAGPHVRLSLLYLAGSVICTVPAFLWQGWAWWLLWPGFALSMVAAAYWSGDPVWLAKRHGWIAPWMWPYTLGAWINSRLWIPGRSEIVPGVWVGRNPTAAERAGMASILDLTAELPVCNAAVHVPMIDLVPPTKSQLDQAVEAIRRLPRPILICCALGYSRSAAACAAWLVADGHAADRDAAFVLIRRVRPFIRH